MTEADLRELLAVFLLDAPGRLARIASHLEAVERARLPAEQAAAVAAAALEAHSLRGATGVLRLESLALHAERLELSLRTDAADGGGLALAGRARDTLAAIAAEVSTLEPEAGTTAPARATGRARRTVLHVEDNPVNLTLVERVIARRPEVRLLAATRADIGLRLAHDEPPDLVLLDLHLPDASGREFLSRLRADPATRDVPVVVVSADTPSSDGDSLRPFGIREYLTKPVDIGRLLELVDELAPTVQRRADGSR